jgi:His-Xaa-Ser system protein HxsD
MPVTTTISFSSKAYSLETIKKASYRFADVMSVDFAIHDDEIACTLHIVSSESQDDVTRLVGLLRTEVLDQDLRSTIAAETAAIRNAILALAFSKTGLQSGE